MCSSDLHARDRKASQKLGPHHERRLSVRCGEVGDKERQEQSDALPARYERDLEGGCVKRPLGDRRAHLEDDEDR